MTRFDFVLWRIRDFSPEEVEATGAALGDVPVPTMRAVQRFRTAAGLPVKMLYNGMTTGNHVSEYHPAGLAVDIYVVGRVTAADIRNWALLAGFRGIGIYWNGSCYSAHLDLRRDYGFWGRRKGPDGKWREAALFADPRHIPL